MVKNQAYNKAYLGLPEQLERRYPLLPFANHCYLRMALDHVLQGRWDLKLRRPAYRYLKESQVKAVQQVLQGYLQNEDLIRRHNRQSKTYRQKWKKQQQQLPL
ncbi:MAG: acetyltransferase [Bacteroidota bacterium]